MSYSLHLGKNSSGIKTINDVKKCSNHNMRNFNSNEYDKNNIVLLEGSKNILDDIKKVYDTEFSESIEKYNSKQTRNDRKINNYLEYISENKKNDIACELIIQVGNKEYWSKKRLQDKKKQVMTKIFQNQIKKLNELLPNFKIANATAHFDEASPHLHIVGVPVANFEKGLEKRVSKRQVFSKEILSDLQNKMRENIENEMIKHYPDFKLTEKTEGRKQYFSVEEYKAILKKLENLENLFDVDKKIKEIKYLRKQKGILSSKVKVDPEFLRILEKYLTVAVTKDKIYRQFDELNKDFEKFKDEYKSEIDAKYNSNLEKLAKKEQYLNNLDIVDVLGRVKVLEDELKQKNAQIFELKANSEIDIDDFKKIQNKIKILENENSDLKDLFYYNQKSVFKYFKVNGLAYANIKDKIPNKLKDKWDKLMFDVLSDLQSNAKKRDIER